MRFDQSHEVENLPVEHALKRLHARQQAVPDDGFVARLEQTLLASNDSRVIASPAKRLSASGLRAPLLPEHLRRRYRPLWTAGIAGIVLLLLAASVFIADSRQSSFSSPPTESLAAWNSDTTSPVPGIPGSLWTVPAPPSTTAGSAAMALGGDVLYRVTSASVQAILTSTGIPIWEVTDLHPRAITANKNSAFVSSTDADGNPMLIGLDRESGNQLWSVPLPNVSENLFAQSGLVLAQDWANHVTAVDAKSGDVLWQQSIGPDLPESEKAEPKIVATGEAAFVVSTKRVLTALDLHDGSVIWEKDGVITAQMALSGDTLGIIENIPPEYGLALTAYDATDGAPLWQRSLDNPENTPPGTRIVGGASWFAFISGQLGALTPLSESPAATPSTEIAAWMTGSSSSIFADPPTFSVVFKVDARSGLLSQVSRWTENLDPQSNTDLRSLNSSAITLAISETNPLGILVLAQDGRVGWVGAEGATGEKINGVPAKAFTGGAEVFPHDLRGISFNVALVDDNAAYLAMRDGSLFAIQARQLSQNPAG